MQPNIIEKINNEEKPIIECKIDKKLKKGSFSKFLYEHNQFFFCQFYVRTSFEKNGDDMAAKF